MRNVIEEFTRYFCPNISNESLDLFQSILSVRSFPKGKIVIKEGQLTNKFYILSKGIVRSFIKASDQKERIRTLYIPTNAFGALSSLIIKKESNASYDCLTHCEVLEGNFHEFINLTQRNIELSIFYNKILESVFIRTENRADDLALLNATQRYLKLKRQIPQIDNLIAQYHIASFLNITPVQLSRIRKKIYSS